MAVRSGKILVAKNVPRNTALTWLRRSVAPLYPGSNATQALYMIFLKKLLVTYTKFARTRSR
jgi:hypothetical protein